MKNKITSILLLFFLLTTVTIYGQPSDTWTQKANFTGASRRMAVAFGIGSKGYVGLGGSSSGGIVSEMWEYNPANDTWTQKANYAGTPIFGGATGMAIGSKGYVGLGNIAVGQQSTEWWEFDPVTNTWTQKAGFIGAARMQAAAFSIGSKGYVGTGLTQTICCPNVYYDDLYEYDPSTNAWTQKASSGGVPRAGANAFTAGSKGYFVCGAGISGSAINDLYEYDPNTNSWAMKTGIPTARAYAASFGIDKKGYVGYGSYFTGSSTIYRTDFLEYNPANDTWTTRANLTNTTRTQHMGLTIGTKGYMGLGYNDNSTYYNDFWEYIPVCAITGTLTASANPSCNGGNGGWATFAGSGGTGTLSYSWSPSGGNTSTGTSLSANTYTCTISDANGCYTNKTITISQPTAVTNTITSQTNVSCNGGNNGSVTLSVSGGITGYTYTWSPSGGNTATASNLTAGTYTCTIKDGNLCTSTRTVSITQPTILTSSVAASNVLCNGGNGSATVTPNGGAGSYTYTWSPAGGNSAAGTNMPAGNYTCTINDANGCVKTQTVSLTQPPTLTTSVLSQINVSGCYGQNNGSASILAGGGTGTLNYSWAPFGGTSNSASNLSANVYTCTVIDANSCVKTQTVNITQPAAITATINSVTDVSCFGASDGAISFSASGGTGALSYQWSPGGATTPSLINLTAGNYMCTITDANNCTKTQTVTVNQPSAITSGISAQNNLSCFGSNDGAVTVTASGGAGSYTYSWSPSGGSNASASSLAAGTYSCLITDINGCTKTQTVNITQPSAISVSVLSLNNVSGCNGQNNGSVSLSASGGTGVLSYSWAPTGSTLSSISNLFAGTYTCQVTDANNCTAIQTVNITQPLAITSTVTILNNVSCYGGNTGSTGVSASGGTGALSYSWAPTGSTLSSISNLYAGTYTCTITDMNSCVKAQTVNISEPPAITTSITATGSVSCSGGSNGFASVNASGGTGTLNYNWLPTGGNAPTANNLAVGNYTCTITDANNCSKQQAVNISLVVPATPNICMLTADSLAQNNIVYWDPSLYPGADSFLVYRYDAFSTNYLLIGAVSGDSGIFVDTQRNIGGPNGGDPQYSSWQYKLAIKDSCGNIGAKSPFHQSIFVQESFQNFSWNAYSIETGQANPITGYSFSRDDNNTGSWHVLVNTGGLSTTDPNYLSYPNGNWRVEALGFSCTASSLRKANNSVQTTIVKSKSNITNNRSTGIKAIEHSWTLYPNPSSGSVTLDLKGLNAEKINVKIISVIGEEIYNGTSGSTEKITINLSSYEKGTYVIQVNTGTNVFVKRLVKQ